VNNTQFLETIKAVNGKLYHLEYHQMRLDRTLPNTGILLKDIVTPPAVGFFRCRVVYSDKDYAVSYHPYQKKDIQTLKLVVSKTIEYSKKYLNRESINNLFAKKASCDDILIVKNGLITDTSIANVAFFYKNEWLTPKQPLLYGTTRQRLLEESKILLHDIEVKDVQKFSQIALMNAMIDFDIIAQDNIEDIIC